jgi:Uma2 family endonuclease
MATTPSIYYPTGDGRPMAETPIHGDALIHLVDALKQWFTQEPNVYIGRNMMLYYVEGDPRKHVSPDAFVTLGIPKDTPRDAYFTWLEGGRGPDLVVEITSKSTRNEDLKKKFALYQNVLRVREYFMFDPRGEYLKPRLQGYRLEEAQYLPITEAAGRLPSEVLDLHFEADGLTLRLYDPATGEWLPTEAEAQKQARLKERELLLQERGARQRAEHEIERLRQRLKELEQQGGNAANGEN